MLSLSLMLAAAVAPIPALPQSVQNDLQCMAIYAVAAGSEDNAQAKEVGGLGLIYYLGKIEVAAPSLDIAAALMEEMKKLETGDSATEAGERCGRDFEATGKRLIKLGGILSAAGN